MLTIVLGVNPINMAPVERSAANILRALLEFIPVTGALITQALDNYGIFAKVGAWMETRIRGLGMAGSAFKGRSPSSSTRCAGGTFSISAASGIAPSASSPSRSIA